MSIFTRPILEINLNNLLDNYKALKKTAKNAIAAAVVKDDAYGIGAANVAKKLFTEGECRNFFVAHGIEAERIVEVVKGANIYVLQGIGNDSLELFKKHKFIPVISSPEQLRFWNENKIKGIKPVIQIETGLNRLGFRESELENISEDDFSYVMSHLACADEEDSFMNERQRLKFMELKKRYFPNIPASLSASDGVFLGNDYLMNMVRLGAAMYGLNTTPYRDNKMKPVMFVKAPVLQISEMKRLDYAGYGASFRAKKDMKIAIISIGYGDGLFRSLSSKGKFFFKGKALPIIGRVSMDNTIVDVSEANGLKVGDMVDVLNEKYDADDMGMDAGTIGYEIISRFGKGIRFVRGLG